MALVNQNNIATYMQIITFIRFHWENLSIEHGNYRSVIDHITECNKLTSLTFFCVYVSESITYDELTRYN